MESQKLSDLLAGAKKNSNDGESSPEGWFEKGYELYVADRYEEAFSWFEKSAAADYVPAAILLGIMYHDGLGVTKDVKHAFELFYKCATTDDNYPASQYYVGRCYVNGDGVEQDIDEGLKWLDRAEEDGNEEIRKLVANVKRGVEARRSKERTPEDIAEDALQALLEKSGAPKLPTPRRIKRSAPPFIFKTLLFLIGVAAVVLVRRMDQMSYAPISEEEAMELAQEVTVALPDQEIHLLGSDETQTLKVGTTVKVLGVYKQKLNKGNSPRVYWTNQNYLIELPDGTRGYGPLMETAIGQRTVLAEGDTAVIIAVKKAKKTPTIQENGKESRFEFAYTLEGREEQYALEDLHIHFPQRVAYLGEGLVEDKYLVANDTVDVDMSIWQRAKKFFLYDIRPVTKKNGFFLFPKYQVWNEFYLQRWFRSILIFLAYLLEIFLIFVFFSHLSDIKDNIHGAFWFARHYRRAKRGNADSCFEVGDACYIGDSLYGVREENMGQAIKWFMKAGEQGQPDACARLGHIFENGESVEADKTQAYKWYKLGADESEACEEGVKRAINYTLGVTFYGQALDLEKSGDSEKAFEYYKTSAEYGFNQGQFELGKCYFTGKGVTQNKAEGIAWFRKAAEQEHNNAQMLLGFCLINGDGVAQDNEEGLEWLQKAARNGNEQARDALKSLKMSW